MKLTQDEIKEATKLLRDWQLKRLPTLRAETPAVSKYFDEVTLIIYSFPKEGTEAESFQWIEFAIRQSWHVLGGLKTVLIVPRLFKEATDFASGEKFVEIQVEPSLVPGNIPSMSADCIQRLHARFSTPNCLVIQDDGFPLSDNLGDFLGKADFWGAPIICDGLKRKFFYAIGLGTYNGGFSLRSRRFCAFAAEMWAKGLRRLARDCGEDFYYTFYLRLVPQAWGRFTFPSESAAFHFAFDDLGGYVALPAASIKPFGLHGKTTFAYLLKQGVDDLQD